MALIDLQEPLTPAAAIARTLRENAAMLHSALQRHHQAMFNPFWHTPGVDPQDILDELGTDAASLFIAGSGVVDLILYQNPNALTEGQYTPPRAPTFNQDGTVTLAPAPEPEPEFPEA